MSRKTEKSYTHLFQTLKDFFPLVGKFVMTDFEVAMRNAIRKVYPELKQYTCWFHLCQAAKRKATQMPIVMQSIKSNDKIKKAYYKLLALPLLPPNEIASCFQVIKSEVTEEKAIHKFFDYFENQWLKKVA